MFDMIKLIRTKEINHKQIERKSGVRLAVCFFLIKFAKNNFRTDP